MSTTLEVLENDLSRYLGDYFHGTADSNTVNRTYTLVDIELNGVTDDWIVGLSDGGQPSYLYIITNADSSGNPPEDQERPCDSLTTGTLLTVSGYPFGGNIDVGDTYSIHRFCSRADKVDAIQKACYDAFPDLYTLVDDTSIAFGNWLIDGVFEKWTDSTTPTYWAVSSVTATQTTTVDKVKNGTYSCALSTTVGNIAQSENQKGDLLFLTGQSLTLRAWVLADTASQVRISLFDGLTSTYSDYHTGSSAWELLEVTAAMESASDQIRGIIYYEDTTTTAYVDDVSLTGPTPYSYDITLLGLRDHQPHAVYKVMGMNASDATPIPRGRDIRLFNWKPPTSDGKLRFTSPISEGAKLRIVGTGYLTQPTSAVSVNVDEPAYMGIIYKAAKRLYSHKVHEGAPQNIERYERLIGKCDYDYAQWRIGNAMPSIAATRL